MDDREDAGHEEALDELLTGGPRAEAWREWREALERRLAGYVRDRDMLLPGADPSTLDARIEELEAQIAALSTEEIISEFVESQVGAGLSSSGEGPKSFDRYRAVEEGEE